MNSPATWLSWIELDHSAFAHNVALFRRLQPPATALQVVVKANAYGHGLEAMVGLCQAERVDVLGVHTIEEAARVRAAGWRGRIFQLGPLADAALARVLELDVEPTVFDFEGLHGLDRAGRDRGGRVRCHIKIETGTHRQGVRAEDLPEMLRFLQQSRGLALAGLSTHFANIEDTTDHRYARSQLALFEELSAPFLAAFPEAIRHAACTAAVLTMPETCFDLARVGIGAYGYWPSRETLVSCRARLGPDVELRPVLTWKTRIGQLRSIPAGSFVGYGCAERVGHDTKMAVLPIGYSDGYDRKLSRVGRVLVHGRRAPVLGRICMNIMLVDVTDLPHVARGDEIVLLGRDQGESIWANEIAEQIQTIAYEVLARLSPALPRLVVSGSSSPEPSGAAA